MKGFLAVNPEHTVTKFFKFPGSQAGLSGKRKHLCVKRAF